MAQEILRVTQKLDIIEEDPETLKKDIFFSRVEDVGAESVLITTPFRRGFYLPPRIGRLIAVRVVADKIPYMFKANLLHYRAEQIPLWEISKPVSFYKIQLRENVRLDISLGVSLEVLTAGEEKKVIRTLTRDISAGGIQVVLANPLPIGTAVKITVTLGTDFMLETQGTILRLMPPMPPLDKYFAGIQFGELDPATKQKIIRFIFAKQAELRMKEKEWFC
jgi:c-di-GMP-binding flagellar brake protein YcgR